MPADIAAGVGASRPGEAGVRLGRRRHRRRGARRPYRALVAATGISSTGDGLVRVALPLLAATVTRNGLAVSGMLVALRLPWLLALPLGAIADRSDRRRMAVVTASLQAGLFIIVGLAVAAGLRNLAFLYVAGLGIGILEVAFIAATSAVVPQLVPREELAEANGRLDAMRLSADEFAGQALGAALFVAVAALPFIIDGVSFAVSAVILLAVIPVQTVRARHRIGAADRLVSQLPPPPKGAARRPLRDDVAEGARFLLERPELRLLVGTIASLALCQSMVLGVLVLYALGPLHVSSGSYGVFLAVAAIGSVAGSILAGRVDRQVGHASCLVLGAAGASTGYALLALAGSAPLAVVGLFIEGFSVSLGNVASMSLRQELVPLSMLGRINSAFRMVIYGVVPIGALAGGVVAQVWSLRTSVLVAAVAQTVVIAVVVRPILTRFAGPDLDLTDIDLTDIDLTDVDLTGIDLTDGLTDADRSGIDLREHPVGGPAQRRGPNRHWSDRTPPP